MVRDKLRIFSYKKLEKSDKNYFLASTKKTILEFYDMFKDNITSKYEWNWYFRALRFRNQTVRDVLGEDIIDETYSEYD